MPISVMSAYFSCQLADVNFTVRAYWTAFAIVFSVSVIALFIFSIVSGTMDADIIYKPLSRRLLDFCMSGIGRLSDGGKTNEQDRRMQVET
jgi:hypothetical protein